MKEIFLDLLIIFTAVVGVFLVKWISFKVIFQVVKLKSERFRLYLSRISSPLKLFVMLVTLRLSIHFTNINIPYKEQAYHIIKLIIIASLAWLVVRILGVVLKRLKSKYDVNVSDNLDARKNITYIEWTYQLSKVFIWVIAGASMLLTFPEVKNIGVTLFASAGIAGLVIGIAAQPLLSNLIAGIQIAITQPIRLDDVVVVEGEWGRIEGIGNTYVVVKIWDNRRLVLPISYFVQQPFQNWTRTTADIIGTVFLYVDYRFPIDELRGELDNILESTDLWDRGTKVIQVTESTEKSMQLRVLVSAPDSPSAWDLRCLVREKLIKFIQDKYPEYLPLARANISSSDILNGNM